MTTRARQTHAFFGRILLIDDDPDLVDQKRPDVVLLDIRVVGMTGVQVHRCVAAALAPREPGRVTSAS